MGTKEKLIERFKALPSDFTFDELEKFLKCFGYEKSNKGKTSGSRVVYKNKDKMCIRDSLYADIHYYDHHGRSLYDLDGRPPAGLFRHLVRFPPQMDGNTGRCV